MAVHHYTSGSIVSIIVTIGLLFGIIGLGIKSLKGYKSFALVLLCLIITPMIIVATYYKAEIPTTRLHIIMPLIALVASYGLYSLVKNKTILLLLVTFNIVWEIRTFYIDMPIIHNTTTEALTLMYISESNSQNICVVHDNNNHILKKLIAEYKFQPACYYNLAEIDPSQYCDCNSIVLYIPNHTQRAEVETMLLNETTVLSGLDKIQYYDPSGKNNLLIYTLH